MKVFYNKFSQILEDILSKYSVDITRPLWEVPKDKKNGDASTMIALKIASKIKEDPLDVACKIKETLEKEFTDGVESIEILRPGFVNVFISKRGLIDSLNEILEEKDKFFREKRKRKVLLEFVSANPTGPLSIAHGRQAVVGDVIGRALEFLGDDVCREYYINDAGKQIDLLVESVGVFLYPTKKKEIPQGGYQGEYVKDIANVVLENKDFCANPKEFNLKKFVTKHILSWIEKDLTALDIKFNNWVSQKKIIEDGKVESAIEFLKKKKLVYKQEDAIWFNSTKFGDDKDRVLEKADGELTYFASDIAYHKDKAERGYDKLINLWGPDHHGYIKRVKASLKALGYNQNMLDILIIQLVSLKTKEKMSKRLGTAILLSDLEKEVGADAVRFYYLLRRNSSPLEFDIDLAKSFSFDNPLYYIQYAHARICSIFRKVSADSFKSVEEKFLETEEFELIRDILQFNNCLNKVYYNLEPVFITEYLRSLASKFHKFYEVKKVITDDPEITRARLSVLEAVRLTIEFGLKILGITPLRQM